MSARTEESPKEECTLRLRYSLTADSAGGMILYGVSVELVRGGGTERAQLRELTSDRTLALRILRAMKAGAVTPCAAPGVAEDMLAEEVMRRAK